METSVDNEKHCGGICFARSVKKKNGFRERIWAGGAFGIRCGHGRVGEPLFAGQCRFLGEILRTLWRIVISQQVSSEWKMVIELSRRSLAVVTEFMSMYIPIIKLLKCLNFALLQLYVNHVSSREVPGGSCLLLPSNKQCVIRIVGGGDRGRL